MSFFPICFPQHNPQDQNMRCTCRQRSSWRVPIRALAQEALARLFGFALKPRRIFGCRETRSLDQ